MVIFTYEDYLKYKETQDYILSLRKKLEEQVSYEYVLNDVEENYILKSSEENQSKTEKVTKGKSSVKKINNEHDKIFRTVLDKKTDLSKFIKKFLGLNIDNEPKENKQLFKEINVIDGKFNLIDTNDFSEEELLKDDIFITKMMLMEKCKDETEIIRTLEKITKIIKTEDKSTFRRILKEICALRIGVENANKILEKIEEGSDNMMAVMEMLLAENEKYINIGRREGRKAGRQEGKMQKLKEIVQKMLAENFSKETIMKITGLKKEEIEQLK